MTRVRLFRSPWFWILAIAVSGGIGFCSMIVLAPRIFRIADVFLPSLQQDDIDQHAALRDAQVPLSAHDVHLGAQGLRSACYWVRFDLPRADEARYRSDVSIHLAAAPLPHFLQPPASMAAWFRWPEGSHAVTYVDPGFDLTMDHERVDGLTTRVYLFVDGHAP